MMKNMFIRVKEGFLRGVGHPVKGMMIIFILTWMAYSNMFHNPFFMDDFDFIVDWPLIQDWHNWPRFFIGYVTPDGQDGIFSPFKTLLHAVNYHIFGLEPLGHHVFTFVGYLVGLILIYKLAFFFLKDRLSTFLCVLLFALHPVHIEYVSSMTGGVDAVGVVLLFASFYFYIRIYDANGGFHRRLYLWSLFFAFLSIYLHELCITLPVMLLWYDFCFRWGKISRRKIFSRAAPFFLLSVFYVLAKYLTLGVISRGRYIYDSFYLTMLVAIKALAKYVYISFFPLTLTFNQEISPGIYSFGQEDFDRYAVLSQSFLDPQVLVSLGVLGAIAYVAWKNYKTNPLITFCIGWFFIGLLPGANIVPSGVYFAERYLYAGSLGFCLLFGYYMNKFFQADKKFLKVRCSAWAAVLMSFIVVFCVVRIWTRNLDGRSEMAVYESAVRANPQSALMHNDLGIIYTKYGQPQDALASFQNALAIRPDNPVAYFSMAAAYIQLDDKKKAADSLEQAVILNPRYAEAHYNLAGLCIFAGQKDKGIEHFQKALSLYREQGNEREAQEWDKAFREFFRIPIPD